MHIFVMALGTRGDVEPFWHLARTLQWRGHRVTFGTSAFHIQDDPALSWVQIGDGSKAQLLGVLEDMNRVPERADRANAFSEAWLAPQMRQGHAATVATAALNDYFISNVKLTMHRDGAVYPGVFVSYDPPATLAHLRAPGSHLHASRTLELVAMPRLLADPDNAWPDDFHFTGFWSRPAWPAPPPADLVEFVGEGADLFVLTMGSMVSFEVDALMRCFDAALERVGARAVVVGAWSGLGAGLSDTGRIKLVDEADYDWLFARARAVLHHGGSGTVAAAVHAGAPSILFPQVASQERWGALLTTAGICAGVFDTSQLDPEALALAMRRARYDEAMRTRAAALARAIEGDGGVKRAAALIEQHWRTL